MIGVFLNNKKNETGISENKSMHLFCQLKGV